MAAASGGDGAVPPPPDDGAPGGGGASFVSCGAAAPAAAAAFLLFSAAASAASNLAFLAIKEELPDPLALCLLADLALEAGGTFLPCLSLVLFFGGDLACFFVGSDDGAGAGGGSGLVPPSGLGTAAASADEFFCLLVLFFPAESAPFFLAAFDLDGLDGDASAGDLPALPGLGRGGGAYGGTSTPGGISKNTHALASGAPRLCLCLLRARL